MGQLETELSMSLKLRADCEQILQRQGANIINYSEILLQIFFPLGISRCIVNWMKPQDFILQKVAKIEEIEEEKRVIIRSWGRNPEKAKWIDICQEGRRTWLRLSRSHFKTPIVILSEAKDLIRFFGLRPQNDSFEIGSKQRQRAAIWTQRISAKGIYAWELRDAMIEDLIHYGEIVNRPQL